MPTCVFIILLLTTYQRHLVIRMHYLTGTWCHGFATRRSFLRRTRGVQLRGRCRDRRRCRADCWHSGLGLVRSRSCISWECWFDWTDVRGGCEANATWSADWWCRLKRWCIKRKDRGVILVSNSPRTWGMCFFGNDLFVCFWERLCYGIFIDTKVLLDGKTVCNSYFYCPNELHTRGES